MPSLGVSILKSGPAVSGLLPPDNTPIPGIWQITGPMVPSLFAIATPANDHYSFWGMYSIGVSHILCYFEWLSDTPPSSLALLGALAMQVYIYTTAFHRSDRIFMQAMVYSIFVLDLLQTAFGTHYAWWVLVEGWGNPWTLRFTPRTLGLVPILTGLISLIVQFFYAWRIRILGVSRLWWPVIAFILLTSLGSCIAACYAGVISDINLDIAERQNLEPPVTVWLALSCACDAVITFTLVYQLSRRKNQGSGRYNSVIHRAIRMAVESNGVTTVVTISHLVTFILRDSSSWYYFFGMLIGKLYSNSLVATLNSRGYFTLRIDTEQDTEVVDAPNSDLGGWKVASRSSGKVDVLPDEADKESSSQREAEGSSDESPNSLTPSSVQVV